jgi:hypothetical protein
VRKIGHLILTLVLFAVQPVAPTCTQGKTALAAELTPPTPADTSKTPTSTTPFVEIEVHEFVGHLMHTSTLAFIPLPLIEARGLLVHDILDGITFPPLQRPPRV